MRIAANRKNCDSISIILRISFIELVNGRMSTIKMNSNRYNARIGIRNTSEFSA